jgi:nanoRNase/pAp phosphatase (c-di-AMP/oligoRNAs hydrolase)
MALQETQQIFETVKRSKRPLICLPAGSGADEFASAVGLAHVLRKLDCETTIVSAQGTPPENLCFLPGHEHIKADLEEVERFVIELDASSTPVSELSYELDEDKLYVYLSPKKGKWGENDVRLKSSGYRHDLIICIGATDLESCAHFFEDHPDFFFQTPIINIDHNPENEHFGEINLVDLTAGAIGEVCHDFVDEIEPELFDEHIATAFLTGMIAKTKSFKQSGIKPKTLQTASKLMAYGADREEIIRRLYRRRSVPTLRLWGRALARLKSDETTGLVWSLLSQQDFMRAGAEDDDLPDVIDELISSSPEASVVLLLYEDKNKAIRGIVRTEKPFHAGRLTQPFSGDGTHEEARLTFNGDHIVKVEKNIVPKLKERIQAALA